MTTEQKPRENRIYFLGNPWSEGHLIYDFEWEAEVRENDVWFTFHLGTDDYYAERDIEDDKDTEYDSDWEAPIVWGNYHSCILSATNWHDGGFRVCSLEDYSLDRLDKHVFKVDSPPPDLKSMSEEDDLAFYIYLLGHDAVADHRIEFTKQKNSDLFDLQWSGKIALAYAGDFEFKYAFEAHLFDLEAPKIG